jgi:hypothetical protein
MKLLILCGLILGAAIETAFLSADMNVSQPSPANISQIAGAPASTAASGVLKVGIVGSAGATVDAATNAAVPTNQIWSVHAPSTAAGAAVSSSTKSSVTTSVNVKASAGSVYGIYALNGAASVCWVELINSSGAGTLGTGVTFSVPLPASITQPVWIPFTYPVNFSSGIAVGIASAAGGASGCGTAGNVVVFYQ